MASAGVWVLPTAALTHLFDGSFDIDSDTFKVALVTSSSNIGASSTTWAGVTNEVANANGYVTGGVSVSLTLSGTTTVLIKLAADTVFTASGGSIVCREAVLYEVGGNVLAHLLLDTTPADKTATTGNEIRISSSVPVFTANQAA